MGWMSFTKSGAAKRGWKARARRRGRVTANFGLIVGYGGFPEDVTGFLSGENNRNYGEISQFFGAPSILAHFAASGEKTKSEDQGLGDEEFAPWILGRPFEPPLAWNFLATFPSSPQRKFPVDPFPHRTQNNSMSRTTSPSVSLPDFSSPRPWRGRLFFP